ALRVADEPRVGTGRAFMPRDEKSAGAAIRLGAEGHARKVREVRGICLNRERLAEEVPRGVDESSAQDSVRADNQVNVVDAVVGAGSAAHQRGDGRRGDTRSDGRRVGGAGCGEEKK